MKKYLLLSLPLFYILFAAQKNEAPSGLMTEFIRDPSGVRIMDLQPEFSWVVPAGLKFQTACQVVVFSHQGGKSKLHWDSGKVASESSTEVEYGGPQLAPGLVYSWKVRVWGQGKKPSGYSPAQVFATGNPSGYQTTGNRLVISPDETVSVMKLPNGNTLYDFGKAAFGNIKVISNSGNDGELILHLGEKPGNDGSVDRIPGGTIRYSRIVLEVKKGRNEYTPLLQPDKRNTTGAAVLLPDSVGIVTPFRYCEVENKNLQINSLDLVRNTLNHYFDYESAAFNSSDTILNQVWELCKYTMKATSFLGLYIDGDRERIPYEADAYINQLGHYYTDREYSMARRTNEYFMDHPTWPTEWLLFTVPMFYNDLMFTGNIESLKHWYPRLKHKTLTSLSGDDGLISSKRANDDIMGQLGFSKRSERIRDIVDWPPAQKDTGWKLVTPEGERDGYELVEINTVVNSLYYLNLVLMSEIAGLLGQTNDSVYYSEEAARVYKTFNEKLFNTVSGAYTDGIGSDHSSLHANMFPLACGLVPDDRTESVVSFIRSRGMACSVYGAQLLLEALYKAGEADYAFELMTATHDRSWWNMIRSGSTIALEAWDMKYKPNSDWNHAWGAAPANIIPGYLWGIRPASPGFARAVINPQLSALSESSVEVPTIRGSISCRYTKSNNEELFTVNIPGNMTAEFINDKMKDCEIIHNNIVINKPPDKIILSPGKNIIKIRKLVP